MRCDGSRGLGPAGRHFHDRVWEAMHGLSGVFSRAAGCLRGLGCFGGSCCCFVFPSHRLFRDDCVVDRMLNSCVCVRMIILCAVLYVSVLYYCNVLSMYCYIM